MQESDEPSPVAGPTFERMVDRALDAPEIAAVLGSSGAIPSRDELREQALRERPRLVGAAASEYARYLAARDAADREGPARDEQPMVDTDTRTRNQDAAPVGEGRPQKDIFPVLAVLVPSLGAAATGVFLLCGFGLRAFAVRPHIGDGLVMAGVIAAAVTAGAALGDLAWILVTSARSRSGLRRGPAADRDPEVCRARETWENALLERGLVPFLRQRAESARTGPAYAAEGRPRGAEDGAR
ncbi:hypothetical protein ACIHAA_03265 [Streptomyces sp. NPDC052040]|uniref:hypothetical protein n=1 Tax=unclassified Streptomyces TaxID=2593676 RepID=UPI0037D7EAAD